MLWSEFEKKNGSYRGILLSNMQKEEVYYSPPFSVRSFFKV